ncbi:MAG: hypothetical protein Q8O14_04925 [bacterium]|nr:hypothetical protein [bacterium]
MTVYFRNPRTHRERATCFGSIWNDAGVRVRTRGRRRPGRLPNDYDDIWKLTSKCWKNYRQHQYRQQR